MSTTTQKCAPAPFDVQEKRVSRELPLLHRAGRSFRTDAPNTGTPPPLGLLSWTTYVMPAVSGSRRSSPPSINTAIVSPTPPNDGHSRSADSSVARSAPVLLGARRQRFYPEQWRRCAQPVIDALLKVHGRRLQWIGWDRSLPRLYVSAEHLTRAVVDLLRLMFQQTKCDGSSDAALSLRAGWQTGATQAFVLVLEHELLELSSTSLTTINAPHLHLAAPAIDPPGSHALAQAQRIVQSLGGSLTASRGKAGGTLFRLSLPVDDRMTLVRKWLDQVAGLANSDSARFPSQTRDEMQISMFIVGRRQAETIAALSDANAQLHSLAGASDYVYRAARGRWLWLTTDSRLPTPLLNPAWRFQRVGHWSCPVGAADLAGVQSAARHRVTRAIALRIDSVLGNRVPPIDDLNLAPARPRRPRSDRASELNLAHLFARPRAESVGTASARMPAPALARQRRWRYPI